MSNELPPLPATLANLDESYPLFAVALQVRAYARAAVAAERERCAKMCEAEAADTRDGGEHSYASAIELCARLIRKGDA